ncbi:MAG: class I SAM-dependent methyltransferase [Alphaproteobacteria bacterium]|nr:class I SAM-dependent methyltransferase [Alphaproteobacteria bacterium]
MSRVMLFPWLTEISLEEPSDPREPFWLNGWLPPLDALSLCALLIQQNPTVYVEVGSGNSTKFARCVIDRCRLQTRIVSVDPEPRTEIDTICDTVIRERLEEMDMQIFSHLQPNDIVFMDNSHQSFMNTDVTVCFLEIIPALRSGVVYGFHDIFLPDDYPETWTNRFYNEQYLLAAYLLGGGNGDKILFPSWYLSQSPQFSDTLHKMHEELQIEESLLKNGACFWLRRA